jgi:hypothetical protein
MFAWIEKNDRGHYLLCGTNGQSIYYQSDYDLPGLAGLFGHANDRFGEVITPEMIEEARSFLDREPNGDIPEHIFENNYQLETV